MSQGSRPHPADVTLQLKAAPTRYPCFLGVLAVKGFKILFRQLSNSPELRLLRRVAEQRKIKNLE